MLCLRDDEDLVGNSTCGGAYVVGVEGLEEDTMGSRDGAREEVYERCLSER